jgi:hypothetical protein
MRINRRILLKRSLINILVDSNVKFTGEKEKDGRMKTGKQ